MSIQSYGCKLTAQILAGGSPRRFVAILRVAERKLMLLDAAGCLNDLKVPPGNHLEALQADRKGQHSIRLTASGGSAFAGAMRGLLELRSLITTKFLFYYCDHI